MSTDTPEHDAAPGAPILVELPGHLRTLAGIPGPVVVQVPGPATLGAVLDAIEERWPALRGTMRGHRRGPRRPYIRFFGGEQDLSFDEYGAVLPPAVAAGIAPLLVVGSISGG